MSDDTQGEGSSAAELGALLREGSEILVGGRLVKVRPITMRQLSPFARAVMPMAQAIRAEGTGALGALDLTQVNWLELVTWHGADCISAASIATDQPEEWVGELDAAEMVLLLSEIVKVNADFFVRRLVPAINTALGRAGGLVAAAQAATRTDGRAPGSDSSAPATDAAS